MKEKIWRNLSQILYYRNDLVDMLRPFFENLRNETINDQKNIIFLKTFSLNQLRVLYQNGIITEEKVDLHMPNDQSTSNSDFDEKIEKIISGDKVKEFQEFTQIKDIKFSTITKSFNEVDKMKIPLIQYCIMKNSIECFKYLLVNGYDDPNKIMKDSNFNAKRIDSYKWDCMATAIYYGNNEIIRILITKRIEKGPIHLEPAILSYRNLIAEEILDEMNEKKAKFKDIYIRALSASAKSNNIKGVELLLSKDLDVNEKDYYFFIIIKRLFSINII